MPPFGLKDQLRILTELTARAEEQGDVDLRAAATEFNVSYDVLIGWINDLVYLERRLISGDKLDLTDAYYVEDGILMVSSSNWLRDLESDPPEVGVAVALLIAATQYGTMGDTQNLALRTAKEKLTALVGQTYPVIADDPPMKDEVAECIGGTRAQSRSIRIRYVSDSGEVTEREVDPYDVVALGDSWYLLARDRDKDALRWFRIDRIITLVPGDHRFDPPPLGPLPDGFDLSAIAVPVTVDVDPAILDAIDDVDVSTQTPLEDGRVRAEVVVYGPSRLEHFLVAIGPEAEVVAPAEFRSRRAAHAAALLARLG
ncbi:MAG: helix-turn-helix transcriptional regulator [Actinomycetes bacterium]